uniref:Uncharacterized protein n=1 Tax=Oryza nivara TaxID=4536 RepID=A0A0E0FWG5_ORYNI
MESETSGVVAGRGVAWSRRSAATDEENEIITRLILGDEITPPLRRVDPTTGTGYWYSSN